jgi:Zn-dependent protease with chaperone function
VSDGGPASLEVLYFDGQSARARPALMRWGAQAVELRDAQDPHARIAAIPHADIEWPERTHHGLPVAHLRAGGSLQAGDAQAWHRWLRRHRPRGESWVVRAQQSWRAVLASAVLVVAGLAGLWQWGLPWGAQAALAWIPPTADASVGEFSLQAIDKEWMKPSTLPEAKQEALRRAFQGVVARQPAGQAPAYRLLFRQSRIGPNAFALPGGSIILTDELVELLGDDEATLMGVLAHELGHVKHRHGMRLLVQAAAVGVVASVVWGDISSIAAGVPVLLGQAGYSRAAEWEADQNAARMLRHAGLSPAAMLTLFERLAEHRRDKGLGAFGGLGIAISSHPADEERIRFFREAAAGLPTP